MPDIQSARNVFNLNNQPKCIAFDVEYCVLSNSIRRGKNVTYLH